MWSFRTNGNFIDFVHTDETSLAVENTIVSLHNTSKCVDWSLPEDTTRISFTIDEAKYSNILITDIDFDGTPMNSQDDFETGIEAMFPGLSGSPGGSGLPLDLTDDVTRIENTLDESWGTVLNVTQDAEEWFVGSRWGNFDASHFDGGYFRSDASGFEFSYSNTPVRDDDESIDVVVRGNKNSYLVEVYDATQESVADFQLTGGTTPNTLLASYDDDFGNVGAQQITIINSNIPKSQLLSYDAVNQSQVDVYADKVLTTFAEKNGDPDASNIPDGYYGIYKHTGTNAVKLWVNDGGSFKSVTLA